MQATGFKAYGHSVQQLLHHVVKGRADKRFWGTSKAMSWARDLSPGAPACSCTALMSLMLLVNRVRVAHTVIESLCSASLSKRCSGLRCRLKVCLRFKGRHCRA